MFRNLQNHFLFTRRERNALIILGVLLLAYFFYLYISTYRMVYTAQDFDDHSAKAIQDLFDHSADNRFAKSETYNPEADTFENKNTDQKTKITNPKKEPKRTSHKSFQPICINASDSTTLRQLPGIGEVLSGRIVRFRNWLGGFHSVSQLEDVFGIDRDDVARLEERITIETGVFRQIDINTVNAFNLARHPYISREAADMITGYRDTAGYFQEPGQLRKITIEDVDWEKVLPYLNLKAPHGVEVK
jgi:competence protein ComEA